MGLVTVCSRSFSKHPTLCRELEQLFPSVKLNSEGLALEGDTLVSFLRGAEKAIIGLEKIDNEILSQLPDLKVIAKYGVGTDGIDFEALNKHQIGFGWTPGVNRRSVAELALAFILSSLRHLSELNANVKSGHWKNKVGRQLSGQIVGILGLGNVGQELVKLLTPFGCRLIAHDIADRTQFAMDHNVELLPLDELLKRSEILSLHLPLDKSTRGLLSQERLDLLRRNSVLVNTARGHIIDEIHLAKLLEMGQVSFAAFDVLASEPPPPDHPLLRCDNFSVTPHIGGSTEESILAMGRAAIAGLTNFRAPSS